MRIICLKEVCYKNVIMNENFTSQNPKSPLSHGHDFFKKVKAYLMNC